ncbi:MAG: nucleotidyltransferase domain-containing protein [Thermoplasmata archaeon]|nr:nucleotidyltransferase domain-containing protein [Thermoplasmata archaeon]
MLKPTSKGISGLKEVLTRVLESTRPSPREREAIIRVGMELLSKVEEITRQACDIKVRPVMAGSVAKGTMMKDPDLDIFLLFPPDTDHETLERLGLEIGTRSLDRPTKKYTQHPYITGSFGGFAADIVPCLDIKKGGKVQTAMDRTPHHTEYVRSRLTEGMEAEVVLLKSFLKGIGAYGAEETVRGFSGYLAELMVLYFGGFIPVLTHFSSLEVKGPAPGGCEEIRSENTRDGPLEPLLFDRRGLLDQAPVEKERYLELFRNDRYIVIDPIDPGRNVASPIASQTLDLTTRACSSFLEDPSMGYFHPFTRRPNRPEEGTRNELNEGVLISVPLPEGDPGMIMSQLRKDLIKASRELVRGGFDDVRMRYLISMPPGHTLDPNYLKGRFVWEGGSDGPGIFISLDAEPTILDEEFVHSGPPIGNKQGDKFRSKHGQENVFEQDGLLMVRKRRTLREVGPMFMRYWNDTSHPSRFKDIEPTLHPQGEAGTTWVRSVLQYGPDLWDRPLRW